VSATIEGASSHAAKASALLATLARQEEELADLNAERDLELAVSGGYARLNADRRWTLELAIANALTAIALELTVEVE
jgi:hypothetical protein